MASLVEAVEQSNSSGKVSEAISRSAGMLSTSLSHVGQHEEAFACAEIAVAYATSEDRLVSARIDLARSLILAGQPELAIELVRPLVESGKPRELAEILAEARLFAHDYEGVLDEPRTLPPDCATLLILEAAASHHASLRPGAYADALRARRDEALRDLDGMADPMEQALFRAVAHLSIGDVDAALGQLSMAESLPDEASRTWALGLFFSQPVLLLSDAANTIYAHPVFAKFARASRVVDVGQVWIDAPYVQAHFPLPSITVAALNPVPRVQALAEAAASRKQSGAVSWGD